MIIAFIVLITTITTTSAQSVYQISPDGIQTRFDYIVTAGDISLHNTVIALIVSMWAVFLVYTFSRRKRD